MTTKTETKPQSTDFVQSAIITVRDLFIANRQHIAKILPRRFLVEDLLELGLTAMQENPKLAECHPATLLGALIKCRQMGLKPNTPAGHAHLVPFNNSRKNRLEAQFIPGYRGLCHVVQRGEDSKVAKIEARTVHANDVFNYNYGTDAKVEHVPCKDGKPGEPTHYYAVAKIKGEETQFDVMTVDEVNRIRNRSQGYRMNKENSPWTTDSEEMGKKTVVRRLCKMLPLGEEVQEVAGLDERADLGLAQDLGMLASPGETATLRGPEPVQEPQSAQLKEKPVRKPETNAFDEKRGEGVFDGYVDSVASERRGRYVVHLAKCGSFECGTFGQEELAQLQAASDYGYRVKIGYKRTAKGNNNIASIEKVESEK